MPIELRSRQGHGSVFGLRLNTGNGELVDKPKADPLPRWDLSNRCVLVIDDEQEILEAMNVLLNQWGLRVVVGQTYEAALDELQRQNLTPDLMLVDMRLADGVSGIDVMNAIRERSDIQIPGILVTGDTGPEQVTLAQASGYKVLHKPVRPPRLRSMVQKALTEGTKHDA
jgi:CheY-like chemotaxis protein